MAHVGEVNLRAIPWRNTAVLIFKLPRIGAERRTGRAPIPQATPDAVLYVGAEGSLIFEEAAASAYLPFGDGALRIVAAEEGEDGNDLTITLTDPESNNEPLAVSVTGDDIEVTLGTDGSANIVSTLEEIAEAIASDQDAAALVHAVVEGDGDQVAGAVAQTALAGGGALSPGFYGATGQNPEGEWEYISFRLVA